MRGLGYVLFVALASAALFEGLTRLVPSVPARVASLEPERIWEDRFLEMMRRDRQFIAGGFHSPHPTRGWIVSPNVRKTVDGFAYTTNERGHRSLNAYRRDPAKYTVLAIGDSFTFGMETNDTATWPYLLEERDPRLQVINLGVSGYGVDQMYITLRETIADYAPDAVVVAFIGDDLRRVLLSFRDYKKPRFVLRGDQLELTNVPIGSPDDIIAELETRRRWADRSLAARFARGAFRQLLGLTSPPDAEPLREGDLTLVTRLFDEMRGLAREHRAEFLLTYLSYGEGIFDASRSEEGEAFLRDYGMRQGVATLDTRPFFTEQPRKDWVKGHFQLRENLVVRDAVATRLSQLLAGRRPTLASEGAGEYELTLARAAP